MAYMECLGIDLLYPGSSNHAERASLPSFRRSNGPGPSWTLMKSIPCVESTLFLARMFLGSWDPPQTIHGTDIFVAAPLTTF